jgi:iron complex transport system ATP-binding protein
MPDPDPMPDPAPMPDPEPAPSPGPAARLAGVEVRVGAARLLTGVDLEVAAGRHLAVLGPNGAGKTTLLRVLATRRFPSAGTAEVLGARFGAADLRAVRPRIGFVSVAADALDRARARVDHLVAVAPDGGTWPVGDPLAGDPGRAARVVSALARVGIEHLAARRLDTLSQGERQRVRIARALVAGPDLLLLDEPFAGLDLGGRESLLADLGALLTAANAPTTVLVTHHLEELPPAVDDAVLLRGGRVVAAGPVAGVLTDAPVSEAFGLAVRVARDGGRWRAVAAG